MRSVREFAGTRIPTAELPSTLAAEQSLGKRGALHLVTPALDASTYALPILTPGTRALGRGLGVLPTYSTSAFSATVAYACSFPLCHFSILLLGCKKFPTPSYLL